MESRALARRGVGSDGNAAGGDGKESVGSGTREWDLPLGGRASTGDSGMVPEGERVRSRAASECGGAISGSAHRARSLGGLTAEGERASSGGRASSELRMLGRSCRRIGAAGGGVAVTGVSGTVETASVTSAVLGVVDMSGRGGFVRVATSERDGE